MIEAPKELAARPQWVAWRYVHREGEDKPTKVPVNARTGRLADTTDPSTWSSYIEANAYVATSHADGIGYVLSADDPYVGLDLDKCRDPVSGAVEGWAKAILYRMKSYTEISPSGTGLRVFVIGTLPPHGRHKGHIEVYAKARFLTITGERYLAAPSVIADRHEELLAWHREVWPEPEKKEDRHAPVQPHELADADLLNKAASASNGAKFTALWNGDYSSYESRSEADLALVNILAFYAGPDPARIDILFRLSGMWREKWERPDYRSWTINKALDGRTDYYNATYRSSGTSHQFVIPPPPTETDESLLVDLNTMATVAPDRGRQLIQNLIWEGRTHWFYSGPGAGKTIFELAALLHMAAGKAFHGLEVVQGGAVIIEEDSPNSVISEYILMLADIYGMDLDLPIYFNRKRGLRILDAEGVAYMRRVIAAAPVKPAVCLIDACERVVPSERFNSRELAPLADLLNANLADGITNIVIDHTRKPQPQGDGKLDPVELLYGGRTKSAISDVMMYLSGRIKDRAWLTYPKFRGDEPAPIQISFDGAAGFTIKQGGPKLTENERTIVMVINNSFGQPLASQEISEAAGIGHRTTLRAIEKLIAIGWLLKMGDNRSTQYVVNNTSGGIFGA